MQQNEDVVLHPKDKSTEIIDVEHRYASNFGIKSI